MKILEINRSACYVVSFVAKDNGKDARGTASGPENPFTRPAPVIFKAGACPGDF